MISVAAGVFCSPCFVASRKKRCRRRVVSLLFSRNLKKSNVFVFLVSFLSFVEVHLWAYFELRWMRLFLLKTNGPNLTFVGCNHAELYQV